MMKFVTGIMRRSKKVRLGFVVVDTRTEEYLSEVSARRAPARATAKRLYDSGRESVGVHTLEAHVPDDWKRGDSLEGYVEPDVLHLLEKR
jgi:hypothetical protein